MPIVLVNFYRSDKMPGKDNFREEKLTWSWLQRLQCTAAGSIALGLGEAEHHGGEAWERLKVGVDTRNGPQGHTSKDHSLQLGLISLSFHLLPVVQPAMKP